MTLLVAALAVLATAGSAVGLFSGGGPGRHVATTARGSVVTLYGEGLYDADTWLIGVGNRGQDVAILLVEVPLLLLVLRWYGGRRAACPAVLCGVLAFFSYYYVSMVFATAQNRLFPVYVAAAAVASFALALVAARLNLEETAAAIPGRPGRRAVAAYLIGVAVALIVAWLPRMLRTAVTGRITEAVGPYTSAATEALDLGAVVPVVVLAAVLLLRGADSGKVLALVILVLNVAIGIVLMAQGIAQLVDGVPLTVGEIIVKMMTFALLTLIAAGMLARMRSAARSGRRRDGTA